MMSNWVFNVRRSQNIKHIQYLNVQFSSDSAVRVRFAPSPTGIYFITIAWSYKIYLKLNINIV